MMKADQFWSIIQASRGSFDPSQANGNMERQVQELQRLLSELPPEEIAGFRNRFRERMDAAFRWDLWGAASIIAEGCSEDGFVYFRCWLISMGQRVFEEALEDPESLAGIVDAPGIEDVFFEELLYVPAEVFEEVTGRELPPVPMPLRELPEGERWSSSGDDLQRRFPRLWTKYHQRP